jgi:hypothetical protein
MVFPLVLMTVNTSVTHLLQRAGPNITRCSGLMSHGFTALAEPYL